MELIKQEMELFLLFPGLLFRNFFSKQIRNRKWNYSNRKWNYFSYFRHQIKINLLQKLFNGPDASKNHFRNKKRSEIGNGTIQTGNGIISPIQASDRKKSFAKVVLLDQMLLKPLQKQEKQLFKQGIKLFKQEIELFLLFPGLC